MGLQSFLNKKKFDMFLLESSIFNQLCPKTFGERSTLARGAAEREIAESREISTQIHIIQILEQKTHMLVKNYVEKPVL